MDSSVNAPSLPINIITIMTIFPAVPSSGVIPVESPTVPNAETTSNKSCMKLYSGSSMHIRKVPIHTTARDNVVIIYALETLSFDILRLKAPICFLENALLAVCTSVKKVLVLW